MYCGASVSESIGHFVEDGLDFRLCQFAETRFFDGSKTNFNLVGLEIRRDDSLEHLNGSLDGLLLVPLAIVFLELLLKLRSCFLFFGASCDGFIARRLARGINFEDLGSEFLVASDKSDHDAEGSHALILGELLQVLAETLGQDRSGDLVAELEFEVRSLLAEPLHDEAGVVHVAHNHGADCVTDVENVSHGVGHDQLIGNLLLRANNYRVFSTHSDRCLSE